MHTVIFCCIRRDVYDLYCRAKPAHIKPLAAYIDMNANLCLQKDDKTFLDVKIKLDPQHGVATTISKYTEDTYQFIHMQI